MTRSLIGYPTFTLSQAFNLPRQSSSPWTILIIEELSLSWGPGEHSCWSEATVILELCQGSSTKSFLTTGPSIETICLLYYWKSSTRIICLISISKRQKASFCLISWAVDRKFLTAILIRRTYASSVKILHVSMYMITWGINTRLMVRKRFRMLGLQCQAGMSDILCQSTGR